MKLILLLWIPMTHFLIIGKCSLEVGLKARRVMDSLGSQLLLEVSCKLQQTPSDKECDYVLFCYIIRNERQNTWGTLAQLCHSYDVDVKDPSVKYAKGVISEAENVSQSHLTLTLPYYAPDVIRRLKCLATFACTDSLEEPRVLSAVISNEADKDIYRYLEDRERPVKDEPMKDTGITNLLLYLNKLLERFVTMQAIETMAQTQQLEEVIKSNKKFIQELNTQLASRMQHVNKTLNAEISSRRQDIQNLKFTTHILSHYYGQLEGNFEIFSQQMRDLLSGINATLHQIINTGNEVKNALKQLEDENQLQGKRIISFESTQRQSINDVKIDVAKIETSINESLQGVHEDINNINRKMTENDNIFNRLKDITTDNKNTLLNNIQVFTEKFESLAKSLKAMEEKEISMESTVNQLQNGKANHSKGQSDINLSEWPEGSYTLLKSMSGCPVTRTQKWQWSEGYRKYHTEGTDNNDHLSSNIHLQSPVKSLENGNNFITLRFCVRNDGTPSGMWPKGSYCINRKGNCPVRFSSGYLQFDEENDDFSGVVAGERTDNTSSDLLYFCCRSDRSPDHPIVLPRHSPFYLYRYGGTCQRVEGMAYKEEYVYFDTEDTGNTDFVFPPVPDGRINGINITLCYYYEEKEYRK